MLECAALPTNSPDFRLVKKFVSYIDIATCQCSDSFFRYLVVHYVSWHQGIYRIGALAVAAG